MRHSLFRSGFGRSSQSGLTRSEFLFAFGTLLVLAAVSFAPLRDYLGKSSLNRAVEKAHVISTLLSQYATDNNGVYPVGEGTPAIGKSEGIARNLLENNYTPDATPFAIGTASPFVAKGSDFSDFAPSNISWDFTAGATATAGITSTAPDDLPVVYTTGETVAYPTTPGAGLDLTLSGKGSLGDKGLIVAYKANNAVFIPGLPEGPTITCAGFIPKSYKDTATYTQIKAIGPMDTYRTYMSYRAFT